MQRKKRRKYLAKNILFANQVIFRTFSAKVSLVNTPKETVYYRLNLILYYRCTGDNWQFIADEIKDQATLTNDKLLAEYLEKAINHPCEVYDVQIPRNR